MSEHRLEAIFRTPLFSHTCSLCCCSSVSAKVSVPYRHAGVIKSAHDLALQSFWEPPVRHHPLNCSARVRSGMYSSTYLSQIIAINSIKCFETQDANEKLRLTCGVTAAHCHWSSARSESDDWPVGLQTRFAANSIRDIGIRISRVVVARAKSV